MKMQVYNDEDVLILYVKKEKREEIVNHYQLLCWKIESEKENDQYEDILDITFKRPHHIENKDDLQLLQVYIEHNLNTKGRLERDKHVRSLTFGLGFGILAICLLGLGIASIFKTFIDLGLALSIATIVAGVAILAIDLIFIPKIIKKENKYFENKSVELENELNIICETIKSLTGGNLNG